MKIMDTLTHTGTIEAAMSYAERANKKLDSMSTEEEEQQRKNQKKTLKQTMKYRITQIIAVMTFKDLERIIQQKQQQQQEALQIDDKHNQYFKRCCSYDSSFLLHRLNGADNLKKSPP
jgi:16S rRNA U1498 N3-methylase RsmE